jgi:peptide chain release factor subunit 1
MANAVRNNRVVIVRERLRELAGFRPEGHKVLSLFLNLDPSEFPTPRDRSVELQSLLQVVEGALRQDSIDHTQKQELKRDLERVRSYFANEFDAKGTRGLALFSASGADLFEIVRLGRPIASAVVIDDSPFIEPLTLLPGSDGYCVLLINRQLARILTGGSERMQEVASIVDDVHRWHDQGGWSQARYQRGIVKETRDHVKHAADELFKVFKRGSVQRLIIGAPDELRGEIEGRLHSYLRDRIAGRIDIDVRSTPAQVAREVAPIIEQDERHRERECLDRLKSELGRNARGVAGLADTLAALNEQRVEMILLQQGFQAEGWATAGSDFLAASPASSPSGEELQRRDDIIEPALEKALEQSADVVVVRRHRDLEPLGSIGAILRY